MPKRLFAFLAMVSFAALALPAVSGKPTATPTPSAQAAALSPADAAAFAKLRQLSALNPRYRLAAGALPASKAPPVRKQILCGVYPIHPSPLQPSNTLYYINNTMQTFPPGVYIEWQVEGHPSSCCKGVTSATWESWPPNPPSSVWFASSESELNPQQIWNRPCRAWVIIP